MQNPNKGNQVVIVPLTPEPITKNINYIMVRKQPIESDYTYLQFPTGSIIIGEGVDQAAKRLFLQEIGVEAEWTKLLYTFFPNPLISNNQVFVYLGLVLSNIEGGSNRAILDGDNLLQQINENNIIDGNTLAALSAIMMQSSSAKKYLDQKDNENKGLGIDAEI